MIGHKLFLLAHHVIGFTGLYAFARREERFSRSGALLAAQKRWLKSTPADLVSSERFRTLLGRILEDVDVKLLTYRNSDGGSGGDGYFMLMASPGAGQLLPPKV